VSDYQSLPTLLNFSELSQVLEAEQKTYQSHAAFSGDGPIVRSLDDARPIFDFFSRILPQFHEFFQNYPALGLLFNQEYLLLREFLSREYILDICFLDAYVFPHKALFPIELEKVQEATLLAHEKYLLQWIKDKATNHLQTQTTLKDNFSDKIVANNLACQCQECLGLFRTRLRENIHDECMVAIEEAKKLILEDMKVGSKNVGVIYRDMQKNLDSIFYNLRYRLKRSTQNKLESDIKSILKRTFMYPSEMANQQIENLKPFFKTSLRAQGLRPDLIDETEYAKFFSQLSSSIWRSDKFIEGEFQKFVKSVMIFKRKDISANILREYLGEFWIHSPARRLNRKIIYHMGPTNSGKTYHAIEALCKTSKGCYLAPLRLLAAELFDTMNSKGTVTSLLTGEEVIEVPSATHYSSTIEMAKFNEKFECAVIDEIQMLSDPQRGWAWTRALVNLQATEVHVCGDPSVEQLVREIVTLCGDTLEIKKYDRMTELKVAEEPILLGDLEKNDALIVFSRRNALKFKTSLEQLDFKVSIVYGMLSPEVRREQARKFDQGLTDIIVSTDAISMGMNLPIKRIVFSTLTKVIDSEEIKITESEIKQIAGRAGRYKRFPTGSVTCLQKVEGGLQDIQRSLDIKLQQKEDCMVGPDLEIFKQVNNALKINGLPELKLSEFLRLFNTMTFKKPFFCVELKEMIELAEMVEGIDKQNKLTTSEIFGFACAPVNLGLLNHVQYYVWILGNYVNDTFINYEPIDAASDDIDYLETSIKCVELFQWLARHFNNKNFSFDQLSLMENKSHAIEKLNDVLSKKIVPKCTSCGAKLDDNSKFAICEACFSERRRRRGPSFHDERRRFEKSDKNFRPHTKRGPDSDRAPKIDQRKDDRRPPPARKFSGPKKPSADTAADTSKASAFKKYR